MLSEDSENLEKSLCARDKARTEYWLPVIFELSGRTALKTDMGRPCLWVDSGGEV